MAKKSSGKTKQAAEPLPNPEPMLAILTKDAFDDDGWAFEPKWDGVRAIAICRDSTKLYSRNNLDISVAYPELATLHEEINGQTAVLDGEIVAMKEGRPSFQLLQTRMHVRNSREIARLATNVPVTYIAFDLLYLDGRRLIDLPFEERRELLEKTIVPSKTLQLSPSTVGDGTSLFKAASEQKLEGIIAKKLSSRYELGRRSRNWLKVKTIYDADVVIAGWTSGGGRREGTIGALVMGAFEGKTLRFVGSVGTGFNAQSLAVVQRKLEPLRTDKSPFDAETLRRLKRDVRHAHWVRPKLVAAVEFRELTSEYKLRAPSFKGIRDDKRPSECTVEQLRASAG